MIHGLVLWFLLHFYTGHIGKAAYCAFDFDTKRWECNYNTPGECLAYNDYCGERY